MKTFTIAAIVALASVATAQLDNIPSCALNCFIGPLTGDGCSALTDFACHCKKGAALLAQVQPCVKGACNAADQASTISAVESTCKDAGAPIVIPDASAAPSATPTPTPTPSAVLSSAASAASSAVASVKSSASAAASSAALSASSAVASVHSSLASKVSSAVATHSGNATVSATPTNSQFTGGASQATKAAGLLGAAALAMLAL
ncbi:CFEM-domain-containing protein [Cucurbitaria berberidis CBS 394.84]|uniref:CFEM-domain-containing protein n=1 Tax=Cucurbitaria berberidis CBS 394.84 TaxID=1168544 RepID=A0A9P4L4H9_9PLEO|nr:CFEM-domain-containing protein [Cucurbitaria berberidis CBS 394.84]KAF1840908.1 CFEM-domain-containing protein [Cucurbitaria berberidis CBS 394.84]